MNSPVAQANGISKVKVVVLGDSGVGKSAFVHLACHGEPLLKSSWTIGCSVEVKLHEYKEATTSQKTYFIEFWDVGGNNSYKNARHVFINTFHGIILVHDLQNRKSQQNLTNWLSEALLRQSGGSGSKSPIVEGFDAEQFGGFNQMYGNQKIPVLVVGTKVDLVNENRSSSQIVSPVTRQCSGAQEIFVNCLDKRSLSAGSSNAVKLSRFFDDVIDKQTLFNRESGHSYTSTIDREVSYRKNKSNFMINMNL